MKNTIVTGKSQYTGKRVQYKYVGLVSRTSQIFTSGMTREDQLFRLIQ